MSLARVIVVLVSTLAVMLAVVILRTEATRMHRRTASLDERAVVLEQELREKELELSRRRSPTEIRSRVAELRVRGTAREVEPAGSKPR